MKIKGKAGAIGSLVSLPIQISRRQREQWLDQAQLTELRNRRLQRLLEKARAARYYARVIPKVPAEPLTRGFLAELPTLDKAILRGEGLDAFLTGGREGLLSITTSGSTGEPFVFLRSTMDEAEFSARWWRVYAAYGGRMRDSLLYLGRDAPPRRGAVATMRKLGLLPRVKNVSVATPAADAARTVCEFRPGFITGYAIGVETLAEHMLEKQIDAPPLKAVICSAMDVTDHCRDVVARALQAPVVNVYATNELGVVAWECPVRRGLLHINEDAFVLEILNGGDPAPDGVPGELALTSLTLTSMPLIRYLVGDLAARAPGPCPCGRGLGVMTSVQGRTSHSIRAFGRLITAPLIASAFGACGAYGWARRFQIREREGAVLKVLVAPRRPPSEAERLALLRQLAAAIGEEFRLELELLEELPLAPSGKFQYVVPQNQPQGKGTFAPIEQPCAYGAEAGDLRSCGKRL